jgi:hypothetical protein
MMVSNAHILCISFYVSCTIRLCVVKTSLKRSHVEVPLQKLLNLFLKFMLSILSSVECLKLSNVSTNINSCHLQGEYVLFVFPGR